MPLDNYLKLMENKYWKKTVGALIGAIWLYTLADIAASVTGFVNGLLDFSGFRGWVELLAGGKGAGGIGLGDLLEYFFPLLVLLGYLLFYLALSDFMRLQRSASDRSAVHGIRLAYILFFIAALACYLWWPGKLAALVLVIIGYVKLLTGYHRLKRSATFSEKARSGAELLFVAGIMTLVGYVIGYMPLIGDLFESVISLIAFIFMLVGWGRIRCGAPLLTEAEAEAQVAATAWSSGKRADVLGVWMLSFVGILLFHSLICAFMVRQQLSGDMNRGLAEFYVCYKWLFPLVVTVFYVFLTIYKKLGGGVFLKIGAGVLGFGSVLGLVVDPSIWVTLYRGMPDWYDSGYMQYIYKIMDYIGWIGLLVFIAGIWRFHTTRFVNAVYSVGAVISLILSGSLYWWLMPLYNQESLDTDYLMNLVIERRNWILAAFYLLFFLVLLWAVLSGWKKTNKQPAARSSR